MARPFFAARIEDRINAQIDKAVRKRGWVEQIVPYTSYGSSKFIRVLARVLLQPPQADASGNQAGPALLQRRGWRNFLTAQGHNLPVTCTVDGQDYQISTDRNGYIDTRLPARGLQPGWHEVTLRSGASAPTQVPIMIVDPDQEYGLVSDVDDTIITTFLPRPLLAFWNTFVLQESARQAVPGMAELYHKIMSEHPNAPIIYVSTGAWNTAPALTRFLKHFKYPFGPFLLTDWGPTNSGWFRSGQEHKRTCLRDLAIDFPKIRWILVGDDGQHDPTIYGEFADGHPDRVRAIGIRQLSPSEQVLAHGTLQTLAEEGDHAVPPTVPSVRAPDGAQLYPLLREAIEA